MFVMLRQLAAIWMHACYLRELLQDMTMHCTVLAVPPSSCLFVNGGMHASPPDKGMCFPYSVLVSSKRRHHAGIYNCGKQIIEQEGVKSLWKGLTPFATHLTLKYALRMGTNAFYQGLLRDQVGVRACAFAHA